MFRRRKRYTSDLSKQEWKIIRSLLPQPSEVGRPQELKMRLVLNAIFYIVRTGAQWRNLPHDFPVWSSVYYYFAKWRDDGTWRALNEALVKLERQKRGRQPGPTGAVIDTQSVKTTEAGGERGIDGGKKVKGRKRHIITDTVGNMLEVVVHAANTADSVGARPVIDKVAETFATIKKIWADGTYQGPNLLQYVKETLEATLEVVKREEGQKGFAVLPKRWVVERTLAWLGRHRRLSKDYERLTSSSESMVYLASIRTMLKRVAA